MYATFNVKASELDDKFLKKLRTMFKSKKISIIVEEELDETKYLTSNASNRKMLEESMKQAEKGELIRVNIGKSGRKK